jgi:hypothetical protein
MRPPTRRRPGLGSTGARRETADTKILHFPAKKSTCAVCQIRFLPRSPRHRLCVDCWHWRRIRQNQLDSLRLLRGDAK